MKYYLMNGGWRRWLVVSIGWDCNPRFPVKRQDLVVNNKPEYFKTFLQEAKAYIDRHPGQPRLITINGWNEWAEGSYLEPDAAHGMGYLQAVKEVFSRPPSPAAN